MLIEKSKEATWSQGDVVSVKLVSGEEIFGRFIKEEGSTITMAKVMKLVMTPEGNPGFTSVLQTSSQDELEFDKSHCLLIAETEEAIKVDYLGATSSIKKATPNEESAIIRP